MEKQVFKAQKGGILPFITLSLPIGLSIVSFTVEKNPQGGFGLLIIALFLMLVFFYLGSSKYIVEDDCLIVKTGFGNTQTIPLQAITGITEATNPWAAALSLDRIEIAYGEKRLLVIAPERKSEFIKLLCEKNPNIRIY